MYYLDSSALVKLLAREECSSDLDALLAQPGAAAWSSLIAGVEVARALRRMGHAEHADRVFDSTFSELVTPSITVPLAPLTPDVVRVASRIAPTTVLHSLDAIHIATALASREDWRAFVTYDSRQVEAARALGLRVESPGWPHAPDALP
jgi:predicted nucleic acid-binding protein